MADIAAITLSKPQDQPQATGLKVTELKIVLTAVRIGADGNPVSPAYTYVRDATSDQALLASMLASANTEHPVEFPT